MWKSFPRGAGGGAAGPLGLPTSVLAIWGAVLLVVVIAYRDVWPWLLTEWRDNPYYSHGVLVPLPTTRARVAERGFDQSIELARRIAARAGVPFASLLRKHGPPQAGRSRLDRLGSAGQFRLAAPPPFPATTAYRPNAVNRP